MKHRYALIIPALDEAESIIRVLAQIPPNFFTQTIVVDNGSRDRTAAIAASAGAQVVSEPRRGYGQACLAGLATISPLVTAIAFMDADLSDDPADLESLIQHFEKFNLDLIVGSRVLGSPDPGSLTVVQRFGNWLSTRLIAALWHVTYTDLGPLRIIRRSALEKLSLSDRNFGWNIEMQARAAQWRLQTGEAPVHYRRRRAGHSKISGTVSGSFRAGVKILWTLYHCWRFPLLPPASNT